MGENSARDTVARWAMTAEERKNTPPKLLGEDAVFAEGAKEYLNGYKGGFYNILVTTFSPESKYYKKYVANENNVLIYEK